MQKICYNCDFFDIIEIKCTESNLYIVPILCCSKYKKRTKFNNMYKKVLTKNEKQLKCKTIMRKSS